MQLYLRTFFVFCIIYICLMGSHWNCICFPKAILQNIDFDVEVSKIIHFHQMHCYLNLLLHMQNEDTDPLCGNYSTDLHLCFSYIDMKFEASSHLLRLYSLVCARPGQKPRRQVFL